LAALFSAMKINQLNRQLNRLRRAMEATKDDSKRPVETLHPSK
jgi:hypothetical protein